MKENPTQYGFGEAGLDNAGFDDGVGDGMGRGYGYSSGDGFAFGPYRVFREPH